MIRVNTLQDKSDTQKSLYATTIAVAVSALLFVVWGYNFINGGVVSNIASGAGSVVQVVESVRFNTGFNDALSSISKIIRSESADPAAVEVRPSNLGASVKYNDVFTTDGSGENLTDVLY